MADVPQPELVRELLRYDAETGKLFWLPRPAELFSDLRTYMSWNAKYSGKEAFTSTSWNGYKRGAIYGKSIMAHRVIWAMQAGEWPISDIDHIDGDRSNNRWTNLRAASRSENNCNRPVEASSLSGIKGVGWDENTRKWRARIKKNKKTVWEGYFETIDAASAATSAARKKHHGKFARDL